MASLGSQSAFLVREGHDLGKRMTVADGDLRQPGEKSLGNERARRLYPLQHGVQDRMARTVCVLYAPVICQHQRDCLAYLERPQLGRWLDELANGLGRLSEHG